MAVMALETIYKTFAAHMQEIGGDLAPGSLEINGGTINLYFSNQDAEPNPLNPSEYTLDDTGPHGGVVEIAPAAKWIVAVAASGSPTVRAFRVIAE